MTKKIIKKERFASNEIEFRTIDGSNNNLANPELGSQGSALRENVPLDYGDGIGTPAGADRTNPRTISNAIGKQTAELPSQKGLTNLIWAFGQFIDHDLDLVPDSQVLNPISVPQGDPDLDPGNTGSVMIPINESQIVEGTGTSIDNPSQLPNLITSWLDGSNIYGSDEERAEFLRAESGGKLKVSSGNLLPFNDGTQENDNPRGSDPSSLFLAGDVRANENSVLAGMHTLFVREHNRLADSLASAHPAWNDEQIYQRAREINIAQYQNIIYEEYLPTLLGETAISNYSGYDSSVDPSITRIFANAAFRFGHSQLSSEILRLDREGQELSQGSLTLADVFFQSVSVVQETGIDPILRGVASSLSQDVDTRVIDDVRNLLFGGASGAIGRDLLAINIERGRLNGVADYNTVREAYGLSTVTTFSQITSDTELQSQLESVYDDIDDIDAIVGMFAEDKANGAAVGQTLNRVLSEQFTALRDGDRFYYENTFSNREIAEIQQVTLSKLILRNTDTKIIQNNAFSLINQGSGGNELLKGGLGSDTISGNNGNDTIKAYSGDDLVEGGRGGDLIKGGTGNDTLAADRVNRFDDFDGKVSELRGGAGNDLLIGGSKDDLLIGGRDNDELLGKSGDDLLRGGAGNDLLNGGVGSDRIEGNKGNDTADYSDLAIDGLSSTIAGLDANLKDGKIQHSSTNNALAWTDTVRKIENVKGTERNDRFIGDGKNNVFDGRGEIGRSDRLTEFIALDDEAYTVTADVVEYSSGESNFTFVGTPDNFTTTGNNTGTDTLINIEFIRFNGDDAVVATSDLTFS